MVFKRQGEVVRVSQTSIFQNANLVRYLELLQVLVSRNLKVRYRGSFLGIYWSLLNPLLMTAAYTTLFGMAFLRYYDNSLVKYMLEVFVGLVVINFFSASTSQALTSVVCNGGLLNKIRLPVNVFPLSMIAANVFQFVCGSLPFLVIAALVTSESLINVLALIVPLLSLVCFCAGVGLIVSALFVFFRDLPYFYELVVTLIWFSSPIFYPIDIVPANIRPFLALNPLISIIGSIRQIALSGELPDISLIGTSLLTSCVVLAVGCKLFYNWRSQFMDLL
ncbi:ABC transporter permease [Phormidium sp. LEGE 05292]|nr:ABC transporter permease [Phormidium sp. LEGE 05292]